MKSFPVPRKGCWKDPIADRQLSGKYCLVHKSRNMVGMLDFEISTTPGDLWENIRE